MIFHCSADGASPLAPIDWPARASVVGEARAAAERLACPSHVVRNGAGPHAAGLPAEAIAQLLADGATVTLYGVLSHPGLDRVLQLLCPECAAPVAVALDAPAWEPPEDLVVPPARAPRLSVAHTATVVPDEKAVPSTEWTRLGGVTTAPIALVGELAHARGGVVGGARAVGGSVELRLVEYGGGEGRVLASKVIAAGEHPYVQFIATEAPSAGPCSYRVEGRLLDASSGSVAELTIALYEVLP